ncbi:uncharacterized protein LOC131619250 [Vicia villosa]|uniref:uncharacterized protein LOC131619250 n=1 Tax=Vicia villosa TaxID=3911 RepID=UPI00273CE278|nr:uncharacterized protein LOC131619250 [Vicia villosa]
MKLWNFVKLPEMYYNDEGYFILRFQSVADKDAVLMSGPYTIRNLPMLLRDWKPGFNLKEDMLRTIPVWGKLPQLPLHLWGPRSLSKIGSAIGTPLVTNECTAKKLRISYAKLLVEIDITQELPKKINIKGHEGSVTKQAVEYEWKPAYCDICKKIEHRCDQRKKPTRLWVQKKIEVRQQGKGKEEVVKITENPTQEQQLEQKEDEWNTVLRGSKGKLPVGNAGVTCVNEFGALWGGCHFVPRPSPMIVSWNLRGLNKVGKIKDISSRLVDLNPDIALLIETRVKENKAAAIRNKLHLKGNYVDNYQSHSNGRIWIYWNDNKVGVQMVKVTDQMIHCGIQVSTGRWKYWLIAVYAMNHLEQGQKLWRDIEDIYRNQQGEGPWCVIGDFNNVLRCNDRLGGRQVHEHEYRDLCNMMKNTGLYEMDSMGDHYTWTNKQQDNAIYSRIDRIIGNTDWMQQHMDYNLTIMAPSVSNHSLLCLRENINISIPKYHFKFRNCLVDMEVYSNIVARSWNAPMSGRPMYVVWKKMLRLQPQLRALGKPLRDVQQHIIRLRSQLKNSQDDLLRDRLNAEKN